MISSGLWWLVIALTVPAYWLAPPRRRPPLLAVTSLALILSYSLADTLVMAVLAMLVFGANRFHGEGVFQRIARSTLPIWGVVGYFVWGKYIPAVSQILSGQSIGFELLIPLGISYFSFKLLHYAIEMRNGNFAPHSAAEFLSWIFLAPIFTAGPIERFDHFLANREPEFRPIFLAEGTLRIAHGLVKKFVAGTILLEAIETLSGGGIIGLIPRLAEVPAPTVWALLLLTLMLGYLDFSAYSDIAIGSSRLFGLRIMENFNFPWVASNLQGWWQRWHMTLANWCRTYIYMRMIGLTRNPYYAVLMTFFVMGAWHSIQPHWLIWGLWHGAGLAVLMHWGRVSQRRRWTFMKSPVGVIAGRTLTIAYVALGGAFTLFHNRAPVEQSVRLVARAFFVNL